MSAVLLDTIQQRLVSLKMPCALEELDTVVRRSKPVSVPI